MREPERCGSMLRLPRLRGAGASFRPRNEGPLMEGELSLAEAVLRGSSSAGGRVAVAVAGAEASGAGDTPSSSFAAAPGEDVSRVPPHMPQKRIPSGLSLPQRGQRTGPPEV